MRSETRRFVGMLSTAVLLAGMVVVGVAWRIDQLRVQHLESVTTLMLGSSLMRNAIPDPLGGRLLSGETDGRFLRLAYPGVTERKLLDLAQVATKAGVEDVLIEVNPIVSRLAFQPRDCRTSRRWRAALRDNRRSVRTVLRYSSVFGRGLNEPVFISDSSGIKDTLARKLARLEGKLATFYPLQMIGPCLRGDWSDVIARNPDTRFSFVLMPRSGIARGKIGSAGMAEFESAAVAFADTMESALFVVDPKGDWEDENFRDQAHLSAAGAERFQRALIAWQAALQ